MDRSNEEAKAEIYEKYFLHTLPLFRRISALLYVSWLLIEGTFRAFNTPYSSLRLSYGMESATMYVITAALVLGVLHSYLGCRPLRYWFRSWVLVHQVTYAGLLLWRYVCAETRDQAGTGLRLFLLCFCALGAANDHTFKFLDHLMPQMATYPRV